MASNASKASNASFHGGSGGRFPMNGNISPPLNKQIMVHFVSENGTMRRDAAPLRQQHRQSPLATKNCIARPFVPVFDAGSLP
jgi:hypothetical protein